MTYSDRDLQALYSDPDWYDQEFSSRRHEIPFFSAWAARAEGAILEVAAGTGRIALALAEAGIKNIEGKDYSPAMIDKARINNQLRQQSVSFSVEDCRYTTGEYQLIYSATNAVQHLLREEDVLLFLRAAHRSLKKGGQLLIDLQNPLPDKLSRNMQLPYKYKEFNCDHGLVCCYLQGAYDDVSQLFKFSIDYRVDEKSVYAKQVAMRMYFPNQFKALIKKANFSIESMFGGYDESTFAENSPQQIYVLKK